jgi:hypothetical protein
MGAEAANGIDHGASDPHPRSTPFWIAGWRVDPDLNRISRDGEAAQIEPKVMDVLVRLAASRARWCPSNSSSTRSGTAIS